MTIVRIIFVFILCLILGPFSFKETSERAELSNLLPEYFGENLGYLVIWWFIVYQLVRGA